MTEYQMALYEDLRSRVGWHIQNNDLTIIEIIGVMDMLKEESLDEAFTDYFQKCADEEEEGDSFLGL